MLFDTLTSLPGNKAWDPGFYLGSAVWEFFLSVLLYAIILHDGFPGKKISCLKIQEGEVSKCFPATENQSQHFQGVTSPLLSKRFTKRQDAGAPWAFTAPWCQLRSNSDNCYASRSILLGSGKIQFSIKWGCHLNTIKATLEHRQKGLSLLWMPSTSPQ